MTRPVSLLRLTPAFDWRVVGGIDDPAEMIGGLAAQVAMQVTATSALGIRQDVITMAVKGAPARAEIGDSVRILAAGRPRGRGVHRRNLVWLLGVLRALPGLKARTDIVHVHASGLLEPLLACLAARAVLRRPVVLTLHCSACSTYVVQSRRDAVVQVVTRAAERLAMRVASRTLVLTERVAGTIGRGAQTMPDWVDVEKFSRSASAAAGLRFTAEHGIPEGVPLALFVGRVSREKGWPALVTLAEQLADISLHIVVCGQGDDLPALMDAVRARGLEGTFTFTGAVSRDDVAAAMAKATVLVLPSIHEELGSVLIEAMASGLPSVAYDVGGTAEAILPEVTGTLVSSGDEHALAAAVRHTIADERLRRLASERGPQAALARFDAASGGVRLAALYRELTA